MSRLRNIGYLMNRKDLAKICFIPLCCAFTVSMSLSLIIGLMAGGISDQGEKSDYMASHGCADYNCGGGFRADQPSLFSTTGTDCNAVCDQADQLPNDRGETIGYALLIGALAGLTLGMIWGCVNLCKRASGTGDTSEMERLTSNTLGLPNLA